MDTPLHQEPPLISTVLTELGSPARAHPQARAVLEERGLTNPRKSRIARDKLPAVQELLERTFLKVCHQPECLEATRTDQRERVEVTPADCDVCGGSANALAVQRMCEAMLRAGASRLVVVGGTPNTRTALRDLAEERIQIRWVEVDERHTARDAEANLAWADVVVIWGSTPIGHKTTRLYKGPKVVQMARRGVAALADEVRRSVERR